MLAGLFLFVVGCFIGLELPDFDQNFYWRPLIVHRSLLTHGPLVALLLLAALRPQLAYKNATGRKPSSMPRLFLMGFCLASAVHLCFDMFPSGWYGYALIHPPLMQPMTGTESFVWLAVGALVCLYIACRLLRGKWDVVLSAVALATCYGVVAAHEAVRSFAALMALAVLVGLAFIAFLLPGKHFDPDSPAGDISRWMRS